MKHGPLYQTCQLNHYHINKHQSDTSFGRITRLPLLTLFVLYCLMIVLPFDSKALDPVNTDSVPLAANSIPADQQQDKKAESIARDGKLLRSELWHPFEAQLAKGDFFVSPKGNDNWSGTLSEPNQTGSDGPFATIERARRAVRELKSRVYLPKGKAIDARYVGTSYPYWKGKDIVVFIRQGFYTLSEPLVFSPEDGGERVETNLPSGAFEWHHLRDNYVTYSAYPGEKPVISGALPVTGWKKINNVWVASFTKKEVPVLIANGKKQILARTPDKGYFTLRKTPATSSEIPYKPGDIQKWGDMQDNRIAILLRWRTAYNVIDRIDEKSQIAYLKTPEDGPDKNNGLLVVPPRYWIENVRAFLDAPGEWFFDKNKQEICYLPAPGITDPNQANLSVPQLNQLVQIRGAENKPVRNLRFYGLIFEGAKENFRDFPHYYDPTPGCIAVTYENAYDCEFAHSELRACGGVGMSIGSGCFNMRIFRNTFDGLEQGAIGVTGANDLKSGKLNQITRETRIEYNIFSECGLGGGITLGVGGTLRTTISRNYFTKSGRPYTIDCGAGGLEGSITGDCVVEYNHFEDVQNDADDAGVIVVTGMTFNSFVRNNLIHRVHRGFFSDNVAFWFDNMSSNWSVTNNIYYDIEQGEMKTCGTYLSDNRYADNFMIEPPVNTPEQIIEGDPQLKCSNLQITFNGKSVAGLVPSGSIVKVKADVANGGSSGTAPVTMFFNRKVFDSKPFPVIRNNVRTIEFELRLNEPGQQEIAIGETKPQVITVQGEKPKITFDKIHCSEESLLSGESLRVSALANNLQSEDLQAEIILYANGKVLKTQSVKLAKNESKEVYFDITPEIGNYPVRIGNSDEVWLKVLKCKEINMEKQKLFTYISPKAKPAAVEVVQKENRYIVKASGWDFYHAEDAYATVYLKQLKGDFVATVKIASFGNRTSEWYRSGLFVRNDISRSFDVDRGSKGSVLMFSTPGRAGIEYDEFGNGCMHKAASENLPENSPTPLWIRLERHGDRFTGYISLDGKNWIIKRQTNQIPGIEKGVDLGLAAGAPDQKQYTVEFADWKIKVEDE
jgi:regulation of enolase protein 1 (concanavalin A-like superfamily)